MGKSISINKLCRRCMAPKDNADSVCPICGFDKAWYSAPRDHLRLNSILKSRYLVGVSVAEDDNEISYIGWDLNNNSKVLIQEYFPKRLVTREKSDDVTVKIDENILAFEERVGQYIYSAEIVSSIVDFNGMTRVIDAFGENHTAYQISEYPVGITAQQYLNKSGGRIQVEETMSIIRPVLTTLMNVHERGVLHRNITLQNILIADDGTVKLMGFSPALGIEDTSNQGPWMDVYNVCVIIYKMITGQYPVKGINEEDRGYSNDDDLIRPTRFGVSISSDIEETIMKGLSTKYKERYKTVNELFDRLYGDNNETRSVNSISYLTQPNLKQENKKAHGIFNTMSTNQSKDGQRDMNNMNDMNNRPRMGQGQPIMNPMGGQPRVNPGQMNQPGMNNGPVGMQPRMNPTSQNQRPAAPINQGAPRPNTDFMKNTQRVVTPNPQQGFQKPQQVQVPPRVQATPPVAPNNMGPRPGAPVPIQNVQRPVTPQQGRPFTPAPPQPQNGVRQPSPMEPMGFAPQPIANRRSAVQIGKNGSNAKSGKPSISTIATFLVCALIIGITIYQVIKNNYDGGDQNSKAGSGQEVAASAAAAGNSDTASKSDVSEKPAETPAPIQEYVIKEWKSSVVEEYARSASGKKSGDISTTDLQNIKDVTIASKDIDTAADFVHFQRLEVLNLNGNNITDLSPFSKMVSLKELDLTYNNLSESDLSPLAESKTLQKVNLTNCKVKDFAALESIPIVLGRACNIYVKYRYYRKNCDYTDWKVWSWAGSGGSDVDLKVEGDCAVGEVTYENAICGEIGFVMKKGINWDTAKQDISSDRFAKLKTNNNGVAYLTITITEGENDVDISYE